ncbi:hypothetical protein [Clostridium scatologenes]|uniref:Uncharacterized protein n=1 Tax=Clostridium scatologenes TaxID=1548 RepID=A0A0E3K4G7_CLOSL|nr:hypothetical protein [Clostridium scatologenes]AKA72364.1 hypothetical protein CSCA_5239 [Clostridium scatologenes]
MFKNEIIKTETFCGNAMVDKAFVIVGIEQEQLSQLPVVTFAGESKAAKSTIMAKLPEVSYQNGMMILTGKGSTTSYPTYTVIDPNASDANICICIKNEDQIRDFLLMNFKDSMVKGLKSILSSMPKDDVAIEQFMDKAVEDRIADEDAKFRISKLLRGESAVKYRELMKKLLNSLVEHADSTFRATYFETKKESEKDANMMLSILVDQVLTLVDDVEKQGPLNLEITNDMSEKVIPQMISLIIKEGNDCLKDSFFSSSEDEESSDKLSENMLKPTVLWYKKGMKSVEFEEIIKKVTNSKEYEEQSVACLIETIIIKVPGKGVFVDNMDLGTSFANSGKPYIIGDLIGLSNDGLENVSTLARKAMLDTIKYDVVVYVGKITTIPAVHTSYLKAILQTIRPAKLILALTFCDKDDIFDSDDEVGEGDIYKMTRRHQNEFLDIIKGIGVTDAPVIMPVQKDIICLANIVPKRLGGAAERVFKSDTPYDMLRMSITDGYSEVRQHIHISGVTEQSVFMKPSIEVNSAIGDTISKLTQAINEELNDLKARSNRIHHWTLDATLWKLLNGDEHISNAHKWDNIRISVYTNIRKVLLESYGTIKFDGSLKVTNERDADRIRKEFNANLLTELTKASLYLVLSDSKNFIEKSECYQEIRVLARQPKYNKWLIFEELRKVLLNAVTQNIYLEKLLNDSFENACHATYKRILF